MSWPNALLQPRSTGPSTFPGIGRPANDNIRTPKINVPRPIGVPANDNFPKAPSPPRPRGARLPIPRLGVIEAFALGYAVGSIIFNRPGGEETYEISDPLFLEYQACPPPGIGGTRYAQTGTTLIGCAPHYGAYAIVTGDAIELSPGVWTPLPSTPSGRTRYVSVNELDWDRQHPSLGNYYWRRGVAQYRTNSSLGRPVPQIRWTPAQSPQPVPQPVRYPVRAPYPGFYPPLLEPFWKAPAYLQPGRADYSGYYGPKDTPNPQHNPLRSKRPERSWERKYRAPKFFQTLAGALTEGLDWAYALFNSLPFWRIMEIINRYRRLETKPASNGFHHGYARLRYVALTPNQMMYEFLKYRHEVDEAKLITNLAMMQGSDVVWGKIGKAMGDKARGPWDDPFFLDEPEAPDWQPYITISELSDTHGEGIMSDIYGKELTEKEMQRIRDRWERMGRFRPY